MMKLLFLLVFFFHLSHAFYFTGEPFFSVAKIGTTLTQTQEIDFVCEDFDLGTTVRRFVLQGNGSYVPVDFVCPTIEYRSTVDRMGYVPRDGRLFLQRAFLWRNPDTAHITEEDHTLEQGVISGSSLQYIAHNPKLKKNIWLSDISRLRRMAEKLGIFAKGRAPGDADGHKKFFLQDLGTATKVVCALPIPGAGIACGEMTNKRLDDLENGLNDVKASVQNVTDALKAQQEAQQAVNAQVAKSLGDLSILENNTFQVAQSNTRAIQKQSIAIEASKNATELLAAAATKDMNSVRLQLVTQGLVIQQLVNDINGVGDSATRNLFYKVNNLTVDFNAQMTALAGHLTEQIKVVDRQLHAFMDVFRRVKGILEATIYRNQQRRQLAYLSQQVIAAINAGGVYDVFLDDPGTPANLNSPFAYRALVEQFSIKFAHGSAPNPTVRSYTVSAYCSTAQMLDQEFSFMTMELFFKSMGPDNCILHSQNTSTCLCWMLMSQSSCTSTPTKIYAAGWNASGILNSTVDCSGSITTTTIQNYTNPTLFLTALMEICSYGVFNNTRYIVSGAQSYLTMNATFNSGMCSSLLDFANSFTGGHLTFTLIMGIYINQGFGILRASAYEYEKIVYGEMPNNMTFADIPFIRSGNQLGSVLYGMMMAYTPERVGVYRINMENNPRGTVRVIVPGRPTANITSQTINVPSSFHLQDYWVTIGNPVDNSQQYDIPTSELPLVEVSSGRKGKVTYAISPNSTDTLTGWFNRNGVDFDHSAGNNVAEFYAVSLDVNGRCTGERRAGAGSWCSLRDKFDIYSLGTGLIGFSPRQGASIAGTATIPEGEILDIINSQCPAYNVETTSAAGVTLVLTNAFVTPNTNTIVISGACGVTYSNLVTPAQGSKRIWIPACTPIFQEVAIFKINDDLSLSLCSQNISVATNRATYLAVQANADVRLVNDSSVDIADRLSLANLQFQGDFNLITARLMQVMMSTFLTNGLQVSPDSLTLYQSTANALNGSLDDLVAQIAAWRNRAPTDYSAITANYTNLVDAELRGAKQDITVAVNAALQHAQLAATANAGLANLTTLVAVAKNTSDALVSAFEVFNDRFQAIDTDSGGFDFGEIFSGVGTVFKNIYNGGKDLVGDVWRGIKSAASDIYDGVKQVISDVLGLAEGLLSGLGGFLFFIFGIIAAAVAVGALAMAIAAFKKARDAETKVKDMENKINLLMMNQHSQPPPIQYTPSPPPFPYNPTPPTPSTFPTVPYSPLTSTPGPLPRAPTPGLPYQYNPQPPAFPTQVQMTTVPKPPLPSSNLPVV